MRIAIITESFLPSVNGVANSVLKIVDHLQAEGHDLLVLAPEASGLPRAYRGVPVRPLASVGLPGYPQVRVCTTPALALRLALASFRPDVVHLASPINVGYRGVRAASALGLPSVAVYQTDLPGYARRYGVPGLEEYLRERVRRIHRAATLNLAPATASVHHLRDLGAPHVRRWGRGVDADLFRPGRRDAALRARVAPHGERIVGFVGRLAPEKQVTDLRVVASLPGTSLVVVGDGPERARLEAALPRAHFLGQLSGEAVARAMASFDVFVTPGELETFGQVIQEAMASGVPVVAPASGGPRDLVVHGRTGWLYEPGDLGALRDRVRDLVGDDAKRAAMGRAARETIGGRTWTALGDQLVGHYREAVRLHRAQADAQPSQITTAMATPAS